MGQRGGSRQRITDIDIEVMFDEAQMQNSAAPVGETVVDPELNYKATYPRSACGPKEQQSVSGKIEAELKLGVNGLSTGGITASHDSSHSIPFCRSFKSSGAGDMGVKLLLKENKLHEDGVPDILRFAVLLQTDGLPFNVELKFRGRTPVLGIPMYGAKVVLYVGQRNLWIREKEEDLRTTGCDDADSETFRDWVKSKTSNSWAEISDYDS